MKIKKIKKIDLLSVCQDDSRMKKPKPIETKVYIYKSSLIITTANIAGTILWRMGWQRSSNPYLRIFEIPKKKEQYFFKAEELKQHFIDDFHSWKLLIKEIGVERTNPLHPLIVDGEEMKITLCANNHLSTKDIQKLIELWTSLSEEKNIRR